MTCHTLMPVADKCASTACSATHCSGTSRHMDHTLTRKRCILFPKTYKSQGSRVTERDWSKVQHHHPAPATHPATNGQACPVPKLPAPKLCGGQLVLFHYSMFFTVQTEPRPRRCTWTAVRTKISNLVLILFTLFKNTQPALPWLEMKVYCWTEITQSFFSYSHSHALLIQQRIHQFYAAARVCIS